MSGCRWLRTKKGAVRWNSNTRPCLGSTDGGNVKAQEKLLLIKNFTCLLELPLSKVDISGVIIGESVRWICFYCRLVIADGIYQVSHELWETREKIFQKPPLRASSYEHGLNSSPGRNTARNPKLQIHKLQEHGLSACIRMWFSSRLTRVILLTEEKPDNISYKVTKTRPVWQNARRSWCKNKNNTDKRSRNGYWGQSEIPVSFNIKKMRKFYSF